MSRLYYASETLQRLGSRSVLDVGCRTCELADLLDQTVAYAGADLVADVNGRVKYVGDICTLQIKDQFDAVVALDILEHLENPWAVFDVLVASARRHLVVSLPNCYDLKSRIRFLAGGPLGGKYAFRTNEFGDRHRWLMNRAEIVSFYEEMARKHDLRLQVSDLTYGQGGHSTVSSRFGRALSFILPRNLVAETVFAVFSRSPA
jgi:SAM-dependent methyltransferase